jgi:hypothetical protein
MLAPASRLSFTRIYAAAVRSALTISDNFYKDIIMNISENITSISLEVKDVATVLQQVKTAIQQRYPGIVVNLKAERKGVKTTIRAYGAGLGKAYDQVHVLLIKEGFTVYPLTARKDMSQLHKETVR